MSGEHDPKAAEKLIDQVIKSASLKEQLKKQAQAEESAYQAKLPDQKREVDPFENFPL